MKSPARWSLLLLVSVLWASCSCAQSVPQSAPAPLPQNPSDLVHLALKKNGLQGDLKPWHIRVTWQTVDAKGQMAETGTWEEWWAGKSQFKEVYAQPGFQQTYWATDHGDFVSGDPAWPPWIFTELESIYTPYHSETETHENFRRGWKKFGKVKLQCLSPQGPENDRTNLSYCFDTASPTIRVEIDAPIEVAFEGFDTFQGQVIPNSGRLIRLGMADTIIHLDSVDALTQFPGGLLTPPVDAVPVDPRHLTRADGVVPGKLLKQGPIPHLTVIQRTTEQSVIVAFDIVAARDGTVSRVEVVGATPGIDLTTYVRFAQQARYDPATWNGRPIAIRFSTALEIHSMN